VSPGGNSRDAAARERSLGNLKRGNNPPPKGNGLARRHGGYAAVAGEREREKVRELREAMGEDLPLRGPDGGVPPADEARLSLAARCLARLEDVEGWLSRFGWCDERTGEPKPAVELERRLRAELAGHLDALGCSPTARARLGLDLQRGFDLARHWADQDGEGRGA
jgi:hypothetical protein